MRIGHAFTVFATSVFLTATSALPASQIPIVNHATTAKSITPQLFAELEELARVVDISYCVGMTGIHKPFMCLSRCDEFPTFELVTTWNTGPLLSDSCGYIAYDHNPLNPRIVLAFRGTYSIANTIIDLQTGTHEYVPYLGENVTSSTSAPPCANCTVHSGFLKSWLHTREVIIPQLNEALLQYPKYQVELVGHSLGGAVALLAGLEFQARGWEPRITTFGEPKVGNQAFAAHIDAEFVGEIEKSMYRRVTHADDPVVLLPPTEWGYRPHAGELYISKPSLPPAFIDIQECAGDEDRECSAGADQSLVDDEVLAAADGDARTSGIIPARYNLWQLFFSHRDYFWRLGVCMKGGDPWDWKGKYETPDDEEFNEL